MQPSLVLHVDVNRTIIMIDSATGSADDGQWAFTVADASWGSVKDGRWEPADVPLSDSRPQDSSLVSQLDFMMSNLALLPAVTPAVIGGAYKQVYARACQLGARLLHEKTRKEVVALRTSVTMLADEARVCAARLTEAGECRGMPHLERAWSRGEHSLLPCFVNLVREVCASRAACADEGRHATSIVLRSFGADGLQVTHELQLLARGLHPSGALEQASSSSSLLNPVPHLLFRGGPSDADLLLLVGTVEWPCNVMSAPTPPEVDAVAYARACERFDLDATVPCSEWTKHCVVVVAAEPSGITAIARGVRAFSATVEAAAKEYTVTLVRDYYPWWDANGWTGSAGKVIPTCEAALCRMEGSPGPEITGAVHVLLDDTIQRDGATIADVRLVDSFCPVPFARAKGTVLHRTDVLRALRDPAYMVDWMHGVRQRLALPSGYVLEAVAPTQRATVTVGTVPGYGGGVDLDEAAFTAHLHAVLPPYTSANAIFFTKQISTPVYAERLYCVEFSTSPRYREQYGVSNDEFIRIVRKAAVALGQSLRQTRVYIDNHMDRTTEVYVWHG